MKTKSWVTSGMLLGAMAGIGYALWKREQHAVTQAIDVSTTQAVRRLKQIAPLLRLPTSPKQMPKILADGTGLRCPQTGRIYPYKNGILYMLDGDQQKTLTQQALDTPFTAWVYDRFRQTITRALGSPDFDIEVAQTQQVLQAQPADIVLDLACGQGNFTSEWAKRVGTAGLIIGLDYSKVMLARAAYHVNRWGLDNVLLIHGDAHALPFADGVLNKVNCSGGFHQFPNLPQALREIARISASGAVLTTSTLAEGINDPYATLKRKLQETFDLYFVSLKDMGEHLETLGYVAYKWSLPGPWFGYASAHKR